MTTSIDTNTNHTTDGRQVVATYSAYPEAQRAVDYLSDGSFPVEHVEIVGYDVRVVEHVTGRMTKARAAAAGAAGGTWFGLFIGLIVGLWTTGPVWLGLILGGALIGAFAGAVFGFIAHWSTRGERDFASARSLVADRYELTVTGPEAPWARELLAQLNSALERRIGRPRTAHRPDERGMSRPPRSRS